MEESSELYMRMALAEAEKAFSEGEIPVGAVVVCKGRVLARAHNQTERLSDPTAHAELLCITAATSAVGGKYLSDCTLYVTLEPCVMCAGALAWSQIGAVVYGASDPRQGFSRLSPPVMHPKTLLTQGILETECADIIRRFFASRR